MRTCIFLLVLVAVSPSATAVTNEGEISAVQKVIELLSNMQAKSKKEKQAEEVEYAKFEMWCSNNIASTKKNIAKESEEIELFSAEIGKLTTQAKKKGEEIAKLNGEIESFSAEKKAAGNQRVKDHKDFVAESTDYSESIDAVDRAITTLQKKSADKPGAVLLQLTSNTRLSSRARSMVQAFMDMMGDGLDYQAPEANAYEFQSGGIVDMLSKLKDEFSTKLTQCQKEEANSKHAHNMMVQDLTDSIANAEKSVDEKTVTKLRKEKKNAMAKKELSSATEMKATDQKTLSDMTTECEQKKQSFAEKQQLRTEEIEAIGQATEILSGDASSAEHHLSLAQGAQGGVALNQLRGKDESMNMGDRATIERFLYSQAIKLNSRHLSFLANKIRADPFTKVKKMIQGMITKLKDEANTEEDQHEFCTHEIEKSTITRNKLTEDMDSATADIDEGKATIIQLTEEIASLTNMVSELDASVKEATEERSAEKATNKATVADAKAASEAVARATAVLKDFYKKASTATAFIQGKEWNALANKGDTQTFGETYNGQQDSAGGVLAMLEVIASDFANLEADTTSSETTNAKAYKDFMLESKKNKAVKQQKIEMNEADKTAAEKQVQESTNDMKGTERGLLAAERYYKRLVPRCVDKGESKEEKDAARAKEMQSLKESLAMMSEMA